MPIWNGNELGEEAGPRSLWRPSVIAFDVDTSVSPDTVMMPSRRHAIAWVLGLGLTTGAALADTGVPDPDQNQNWLRVRQMMFGQREVHAQAKDVLRVFIAKRAADASVVPLMVRTYVDQTPQRFIKNLWVMIDNNPSPVGVRFQFSPESGKADIETRVRIEGYTPVRAVAEMNDGSLWMDTATINASGGCSAPLKEIPDLALLGRMRFKISDTIEAGKPLQTQLMIEHPNFSGLAETVIRTGDDGVDTSPAKLAPRYVKQVDVTYGGKPILRADVDFTISENPNFRFYFVPREKAELRAVVVDTADKRFEHAMAIGGSGS